MASTPHYAHLLLPQTIGWSLNLYAAGIVHAWASAYRTRVKEDRRSVRVLVWAVTLLSSGSAILNLVSIASQVLEPTYPNDEVWLFRPSTCINQILAAITAILVQSFFASRCFRLLPKPYGIPFVGVVALPMLAGLVGAAAFSVVLLMAQGHYAPGGQADTAPPLSRVFNLLWLLSDACADLMISACLCLRLYALRRRSVRNTELSNAQARSLISGLMLCSFECSTITALCAVSAAIAFILAPNISVSTLFTTLLPQLYSLCLLYTLKSGSRFKEELDDGHVKAVWQVAASVGAAQAQLHGIGFPAVERAAHRPSHASFDKLSLPVTFESATLASYETSSVGTASHATLRRPSASTIDSCTHLARVSHA